MSLLIIEFNSNILSNLLYDPIVRIDSIDDLVQVIKDYNVTIAANKGELNWYLLETSNEPNFKYIFNHLVTIMFNIIDILEGKTILIGYSNYYEHFIKTNKHLGFHLSSETYFGSPFVILYSKQIERSIKERIDSIIDILFESGLHDFWESLGFRKRIKYFPDNSYRAKISLKTVRGMLYLLGTFNLFEITLLISEVVYKKIKH